MNDNDAFIRKLYGRYMAASLAAQFGATAGPLAGAVIAGRLLEGAALSVLAVSLPLQTLFSMLGSFLGVGGATVCARAIGNGRFEESRRVFTIVYVLTVVAAAAAAIALVLCVRPLVRFLGATDAIFEAAARYALILIPGGLFLMAVFPAYNFLRLDGRTGEAAGIFFIMAAVSITLNVVFVRVFRMGAEAVALSGVIGAALAGGLGLAALARGKNFRFTRAVFKGRRWDFARIAGNIAAAGSPNAMKYLCALGSAVVLNRLISGSFGVFALSSLKLVDSLNSFALVFIYAVTTPAVQFIGVFDAERDSKSVRQLLAQIFKWGCLFIAAYIAFCEVFAPAVAGFFGLGAPGTRAAAVTAVRVFAASLFLALVNNVLFCAYQGEGRYALANFLSASRLFLWIVLLAPFLAARLGIAGVWHSFWIAEALTFVSVLVVGIFLRRGNKRLLPVILLDTEAESRGVYKSFSVENNVESITQSSAGITEFCEQNNLGAKLTMAISLAIEEMLVVIRAHCLAGDEKAPMNVRVLITESVVILRIRAGGAVFNPVEYAARTDAAYADDVMGIKMILALAQTIDYRATFGINNTTVVLGRA